MAQANSDLANAFPTAVRKDALVAISELPEPFIESRGSFSVLVGGEIVSIPSRVYYEPGQIDGLRLTSLQKELVDCLLTRHHNGWVRQKHLQRIVCSPNFWIPPFVIQLVGEYVIEILQVIHNNLSNLNV